MNKKPTLLLFVLILLLAACAPEATVAPTPTATLVATPIATPPDIEPDGLDELVADLRQAGATVEVGEQLEDPIFEANAQVIRVDGVDVQVFEFTSEQARQTAADTISAAGFIIGTMAVDWIDQPNFWESGRLIVLYVGQNETMLTLLADVLGEPITAEVDLPPAVAAGLETAGTALGIAAEEFEVISFQEAEWPDGCLGLAGPDEMCTQAIVPGWQIIARVGDQEYEIRTDMAGSQVRWRPL